MSGQVAGRVRLKFAPRLRFQIDQSFDNADHIGRLLQRGDVAPDLARKQAAELGDGEDGA